MTTTKWDLHSGVPLVPAWYMRPLTYPSRWGASKSPVFVSHQLSGLVGRWKGESGFFHSNTKPCKFFGTLSIHLAFRSLSPSTQFPCEKGSGKEEPRSSCRLDYGNGQTNNGRTMLEENLSFCVERDVHHHGNCRSGLVNSIPFVKKPAPHPVANSQWKGGSGFFHSNTEPCKFFGTLSIHLAFRSLSPSTQFLCEKGREKEEPRSSCWLNYLQWDPFEWHNFFVLGTDQTYHLNGTLFFYIGHRFPRRTFNRLIKLIMTSFSLFLNVHTLVFLQFFRSKQEWK